MTLKELKDKIDFHYNFSERNHDLEVGIPNNKGGQGGDPMTHIKGVGVGFDWNRGKFFIFPDNKMKEIE